MSDFTLYDDSGESFGPTYPELCLNVVSYDDATPKHYQDRLTIPNALHRPNACVRIPDYSIPDAAIRTANSSAGLGFHGALQPPRPSNLPGICPSCGNPHLISDLAPSLHLPFEHTAGTSLYHVPHARYINTSLTASAPPNTSTDIPTSYQPHAARRSTSPSLGVNVLRGATSAPQSGFNVIAYGDPDPLRGQRRNETQEDSIRKAAIEEAGGSCGGCKKKKQRCDGHTPCNQCSHRYARKQKRNKHVEDQPPSHAQMSYLSQRRSLSISDWARQLDRVIVSRLLTSSLSITVMPGGGGKPEDFFSPFPNTPKSFGADNLDQSDLGFDIATFVHTISPDIDLTVNESEYLVESVSVWKLFLGVNTFLVSRVYASLQEPALARTVLGLVLAHMLRSLHEALDALSTVIADNAPPAAGCFRPARSIQVCKAIMLYHRVSTGLQALNFRGPIRDLLQPFQQGVMSDLFPLAHPDGSCKHGEAAQARAGLSFEQRVEQSCPKLPEVSCASIGLKFPPNDTETSKARRGSTVFDEQPIEVALLLDRDQEHATVPEVLGDIAGGTASSSRSSTGLSIGTTYSPLLGVGKVVRTPTWDAATDRTIDDKSVDMSGSETAWTTTADISTIVSAETEDILEYGLELASKQSDNECLSSKVESSQQPTASDSELEAGFHTVLKRKKRSTGSGSASPDRNDNRMNLFLIIGSRPFTMNLQAFARGKLPVG